MVKLDLDKRSVNTITKKLKAMPNKLQRKAIRSAIDPQAKALAAAYAAATPVSKRKHKNKYRKRAGTGFLKKSFSVRNSGRGQVSGRKVITRAVGYYVHMQPAGTGRRAGAKGKYKWGAVTGTKKYDKIWKARQLKINANIIKALQSELGKI